MFQYLTLPNKLNHHFPFHVTTNKINITNQNDETENYPHHQENEINERYFGRGNAHEVSLQKIFTVQKLPIEKYQSDDQFDESI